MKNIQYESSYHLLTKIYENLDNFHRILQLATFLDLADFQQHDQFFVDELQVKYYLKLAYCDEVENLVRKGQYSFFAQQKYE